MEAGMPKVFISYSWTSDVHVDWVVQLASQLRENGADVILDKWDLKEGHDAHAFMERMVTAHDIKKVVLICDRSYAAKADSRKGGVGTEAQIMSGEIYAKQDQDKFVAVLSERDQNGEPFLPVYYKSRIYIDLSDSESYSTNFEQLLRWIYDKPLYVKPEMGKKPAFLDEVSAPKLQTSFRFGRALEAVKHNRPYAQVAINEYFETFAQNLERFRIQSEGEFDEQVVRNVEEFLPYRNEVVRLFVNLAQYRNTAEIQQQLHAFVESLILYLDRPPAMTSWRQSDFDNFRFIVHELFLYLIAVLLKYSCFDTVGYLLRHHYYVASDVRDSASRMVSFSSIRRHLPSLEHRVQRLGLRRLSLRSDMLKQRAEASGLQFESLMQADFVLYIRSCLDELPSPRDSRQWFPDTLLYKNEGAFEIFARSRSAEYFRRVQRIFDLESKVNLEQLVEAFQAGKVRIPQWQFDMIDPIGLMDVEHIATLS
jgi:hypothetical protein